jgi:hypothetical protein
MTARPSVRESGILFPSDPVEAIEKSIHGIGFNFIGLVVRFLILPRIKTEYFQSNKHPMPLSIAVLKLCCSAVQEFATAAS